MADVRLFDRLAIDAQSSPTLAAFRAKLVNAVQSRVGADSAAMVDPPSALVIQGQGDRIVGTGSSSGYAERFLANRHRYARSLRRYFRAIQYRPAIDLDIYSRRERNRLAAYVELFLPQGARCILASVVRCGSRPVGMIVFKRHGRSTPFRSRDVEVLGRMLPAIALADAGFQYSLCAPAAGRSYGRRGSVSPREIQVADLASKGMRNAEIAALLGTSCETVKTQLRSVLQKMDVSNRTELAMTWATLRP